MSTLCYVSVSTVKLHLYGALAESQLGRVTAACQGKQQGALLSLWDTGPLLGYASVNSSSTPTLWCTCVCVCGGGWGGGVVGGGHK